MSTTHPPSYCYINLALGLANRMSRVRSRPVGVTGKHNAGAVALAGVETRVSRGKLDGVVQAAVENWLGSSGASYPLPPQLGKPAPWENVALTPAWLNLLTPDIGAGPIGNTTLLSLLESLIQASNDSSLYGYNQETHEVTMLIKIGAVIAGFVVNGMSRTGWNENDVRTLESASGIVYYGYAGEDVPGWNWDCDNEDQVCSKLVQGTANLVSNIRQGKGTTYNLGVAVEGYGFKAVGRAYWIALTVIFAYLCLVIAHVAYTVY